LAGRQWLLCVARGRLASRRGPGLSGVGRHVLWLGLVVAQVG
jgi:hypothetical protein